MKIKLFAFIIAMILVVSCVGCVAGNVDEREPAFTPTEVVPTETPTEASTTVPSEAPTASPTEVPTKAPTEAPTEAPIPTPTKAPTKAPTLTPTKAPTKEPTPTPEQENVMQVRGTWNKGVYTNNFLGLSYKLQEGWVAATDAEILALMGVGAELVGQQDILEQILATQQTIYDFYVTNTNTGSSMQITFENLSLTIGGLSYSERDYANAVTQQLQNVAGMTYTFGAYENITLADKTFLKVPATVAYSGISMQQHYYIYKKGNYMCCIILTCAPGDTQTPEQIMASFTKA